jgi:hypothetical protein
MRLILVIAILCGCREVLVAGSIASDPYLWRNVVIGGGGFVTGLVAHPQARNLIYARTDVGGAYRWDKSSQHWIPITDSFEAQFTGIESLALDPNDTNRVYLAAGTYDWLPSAIFRSDDQGHTWQRFDVPFKMGGNETGRFNGERLVVCPSNSNLLFFGSRADGLWKSTDSSATWHSVTNFPKADSPNNRRFGDRPVGIVSVLFDGKTIYAAASTPGTNFFCSEDGGDHWAAVPGQPRGLRPNHVALSGNGILYLSYGREAGPNAMTDGAVWSFNPNQKTWTNITPLKSPIDGQAFGYGCVAVDPENPQIIMASTFCRWRQHDEIFRSTNCGLSWSPLFPIAEWNFSQSPYVEHLVPHWIGSILVSPFDSDTAWFTTGYGVWSCTNLMAADAGYPTHWNFSDEGLEETVPLALVSPPSGAHLLSGVGDIDGFVHDDLNSSPRRGSFAGPHFNNTEDIAFAAGNPTLMIRVGTAERTPGHVAISTDGGSDWQMIENEPAILEKNGTVAISFDGRTIVLTKRDTAPELSTDLGDTWRECGGLPLGIRVIADGADSQIFYAFDSKNGRTYISTNGAVSFEPTSFIFSGTSQTFTGYRASGSMTLFATMDRKRDVWLALGRGGLWHSTDGGEQFVRIQGVNASFELGFGKASRQKGYPALFLSGDVGSGTGIFRSDDGGLTWLHLNDSEHQFGWISKLTGDPRVFGRVYLATSGRGIIYGDSISGSSPQISKLDSP